MVIPETAPTNTLSVTGRRLRRPLNGQVDEEAA
jgi:hypothetical protein